MPAVGHLVDRGVDRLPGSRLGPGVPVGAAGRDVVDAGRGQLHVRGSGRRSTVPVRSEEGLIRRIGERRGGHDEQHDDRCEDGDGSGQTAAAGIAGHGVTSSVMRVTPRPVRTAIQADMVRRGVWGTGATSWRSVPWMTVPGPPPNCPRTPPDPTAPHRTAPAGRRLAGPSGQPTRRRSTGRSSCRREGAGPRRVSRPGAARARSGGPARCPSRSPPRSARGSTPTSG